MKKLIVWGREHWLILLLVAVIGVLLLKMGKERIETQSYPAVMMNEQKVADFAVGARGMTSSIMPPVADVGISDTPDRLVIEDTSASLLVDDVASSADSVQRIAEEVGGFLINRTLEKPEGAASGIVTVRVPSEKRDEVMDRYADLAVRVVSESVQGTDVTAEYEDIDAKLVTVLKTKAKLEGLLDQATRVSDILEVQRELDNLQYQIDSLRGRKDYLEKASELTKITVYLSTDELALPYTPDEVWRPKVVFKEAVRSLVRSGRELMNLAIWLVVYAPIWAGLLLVWWLVKKRKNA